VLHLLPVWLQHPPHFLPHFGVSLFQRQHQCSFVRIDLLSDCNHQVPALHQLPVWLLAQLRLGLHYLSPLALQLPDSQPVLRHQQFGALALQPSFVQYKLLSQTLGNPYTLQRLRAD
jgi:hypothetical protein